MSCQFCKTVERNVASTAIYADELGYAIADLNTESSVHVLIVPRESKPALNDTDLLRPAVLGHMLGIAAEIAKVKHLSGGYRIVVNTGEEGDQASDNLHVHLLGGYEDQNSQPLSA